MIASSFAFKDAEGVELFVYKWLPDQGRELRGIVQISHGMAETAARYQRLARALTDKGFIVYANDHRGHGKTAKSIENVGYIGQDGFNWMVKNMHQLNEIIHREYPNMPVFLLGHSMGSFLSQEYICLHGHTIEGVILSGSNGKQGPILLIGMALAKMEIKRNGSKSKSPLLNQMSFGNYNKAFKPTRTNFDWLSRDTEEVARYINDPFCGTVFTASFFYDFLKGLRKLHQRKKLYKIPKELPIYIFSGDKDPVGKNGKGPVQLSKMYKELAIKSVTCKLYPDGRHEMFNEINRDEVIQDVIEWLENHLQS